MAYAYLNVDLEDIDTDDLISELEDRRLSNSEKLELLNIAKDVKGFSQYSIDAVKIRLFMKVMDRYSMQELHDLFQEDYHTPVPPNQLQLSLIA